MPEAIETDSDVEVALSVIIRYGIAEDDMAVDVDNVVALLAKGYGVAEDVADDITMIWDEDMVALLFTGIGMAEDVEAICEENDIKV